MENLVRYTVVFKGGKVKRPMPGMSDEGVEMVKISDIKDILKSSHNNERDAITCVNMKCGWNDTKRGWCGLLRCCPGRNK